MTISFYWVCLAKVTLLFWLLRDFTEKLVKIRLPPPLPPQQSDNAIRYINDQVSRATSNKVVPRAFSSHFKGEALGTRLNLKIANNGFFFRHLLWLQWALQLAIHVVQNRRAGEKVTLGPDKQRKVPFKIMFVSCLSCTGATFALQHGGFVPREGLPAKGQLVKWNLSYLECWCYKGLQVQVRGVQGLIHRSFSLHHVPSHLMCKKKPHWQVIRRLTKKKYSPLRRSWWSFYKRHKRKYHHNVLLNVRVNAQHLVEIAWLWTFCLTRFHVVFPNGTKYVNNWDKYDFRKPSRMTSI